MPCTVLLAGDTGLANMTPPTCPSSNQLTLNPCNFDHQDDDPRRQDDDQPSHRDLLRGHGCAWEVMSQSQGVQSRHHLPQLVVYLVPAMPHFSARPQCPTNGLAMDRTCPQTPFATTSNRFGSIGSVNAEDGQGIHCLQTP